MLVQPKKTPTLKGNWPPKKSDNWAMLGLNKDFGKCFGALCCVQQLRGAVLELGLVQQALAKFFEADLIAQASDVANQDLNTRLLLACSSSTAGKIA